MKLRTFVGCVAILVSVAMPFTVLSMTRAFFENGTARAMLNNREDEVRRLTELSGDVQSLAPAQASMILLRHRLSSAGDLANRLALAQGDLALARAEFVGSAERLRIALVIGFLCVGATSWAAVSLGTVWPRTRTAAVNA